MTLHPIPMTFLILEENFISFFIGVAAQFLFWEYLFGIFGIGSLKWEAESCALAHLHPAEAGRRLRKTARLYSCQGAHHAPVGLSFYVFSCDNLSEWTQQHAIAYRRGFSSFSSQKATNQSSTQADECFAIGYSNMLLTLIKGLHRKV